MTFKPPPLGNEVRLLSLAVVHMLYLFAYPSLPSSGYAKFTIGFDLENPDVTVTVGHAIRLYGDDGKLLPISTVYGDIVSTLNEFAKKYEESSIVRLTLRVYTVENKVVGAAPSGEGVEKLLEEVIRMDFPQNESKPIRADEIRHADLETLITGEENTHKPYAAGLMLVLPKEPVKYNRVETYFSEDYNITINSFDERSSKVLEDFVSRIEHIAKGFRPALTIYFHNLGRFDGLFLLKHLTSNWKGEVRTIMRNNRIYEISVKSGKRVLFRFRDSLNMLRGTLDSLSKNLCPELGHKGFVDHKKVTLQNLESMREELIDYLRKDVLLLGGVMQKAQKRIWDQLEVDIEKKLSLSALALYLFRQKFYEPDKWPIYIPNPNEDRFLREGYYGGHVDTYIPVGEKLHYYDVNSLYPFVMKENIMPTGRPVWHGDLRERDIDSLFGFIRAYVICPRTKNFKRPFLPYRMEDRTLVFPTGKFVGVYFSEELKYAKKIGYTVVPMSGYLFEKGEGSPFKDFVSSLSEKRKEAKKEGNVAMDYVYKILMNSLYGRFGINPESTTTEICDDARLRVLVQTCEKFIYSEPLRQNLNLVAYIKNTNPTSGEWRYKKNAAVQLSAAITAYARIYLYPYISREDAYYTDTDSVVVKHPLPCDVLSPFEIGKLKLEDEIEKARKQAPQRVDRAARLVKKEMVPKREARRRY
ncbi:DNA polymerase-like [Solanum dulcamara]|uniref:DNA polymerase-like n=1 Tax=Solanum dulcamara TaxID=45834 RepID=UPI002485214C|nr:DNA polymerase-like [Solanum dulcamara]